MNGYHTFSQEQKDALWQRMEQGDETARETLILSNERLVWSVVSRFSTVSERREDLFQAGMVGLMRAVDRFDFRRGTSFATFAVPHIFGEMSHLYRKLQNGGRRVSSEQINCAEREFIEQYGRSPKLDELAEELGCNPQDILQQHEIPMEEAEDVPDGRWEDSFQAVENRLFFHRLFRSLPLRQRQIIYERYYRQKTQSEVAAELEISQTRVSRLEKDALRRLEEVAKEGR